MVCFVHTVSSSVIFKCWGLNFQQKLNNCWVHVFAFCTIKFYLSFIVVALEVIHVFHSSSIPHILVVLFHIRNLWTNPNCDFLAIIHIHNHYALVIIKICSKIDPSNWCWGIYIHIVLPSLLVQYYIISDFTVS